MSGQPGAKSPHEAFYYYGGRRNSGGPPILRGIRVGGWKLLFDRRGGRPAELYDLNGDISETRNRIEEHPELAERLEKMAREFTQRLRVHSRPHGRLSDT